MVRFVCCVAPSFVFRVGVVWMWSIIIGESVICIRESALSFALFSLGGTVLLMLWSFRCGGMIGLYYLIKRGTLLYLNSGNGSFHPSPYLDVHGEPDISMRYVPICLLSCLVHYRHDILTSLGVGEAVDSTCTTRGMKKCVKYG
jgi:Proteolysis_6 C-terminal